MSPDLYWHIGEEAEQETIVKTTAARRSRRSWIAILIVVVLGAGLGAVYRSIPEPVPRPTPSPSPTPRPTPTHPAVPAGLYDTIDREAQALASGAVETVMALRTPQEKRVAERQRLNFRAWGRPTDDRPLYTIIDFNLRSQTKAWADIRQFRSGRSFRETRFYRWQEDRWLRSDPDFFYWSGQTETLDTQHLQVVHFIEDHELVQAVADQLEELYTSLCANLNCAEVTPPLTYTVNMNNYQLVSDYGFGKDGRTLSLLSPRVTGVYEGTRPPYLKSDELPYLMSWIIAQRIVYSQAVGETYSSATVPDMAIMLVTIGNWAVSRVNNWAAAEKLRAHSIRLSLQPPLPLKSLWEPVADENWQKSYEEAFAVVYFIEEHYGEAAVPNILKNLGQAQSFSDLIEKSLGVSFTEFEQEWQMWLNRQGAEDPR